ncbi:u29-Nephitoxin-Nsp1f_1 [Trichonephila inaurata madagascariensis]|uniref:U29-Nephitoxin-Nsp1f_1 n=1 Tax=Trichonephila inaurata madagascariensis TaxID=2747483 RepID=A0A8X6X4U7_9ARAC|nr:u29-Nephitoxin-Nsp1f_1 [Trichonephila inaurata madagascariensis]
MLEYCIVSIAVLISSTSAAPLFQNGEYIVPNDTAQCANDLIDWCNGLNFPKKGEGVSIVSITISEPDGYCRYFCLSDSEAANCTKDGSPWISCSNDHQLLYKGKPLTKDSEDGADDEICKAADRAFNDLFIENLTANNTTLSFVNSGLESFFREFHQQMKALQNIFDNFGFPFGTDGSRSFNSEGSDYETGVDQIEKE